MVSVLVCILPSLVSVESKSWRQFLPLPHRLLVHYLTRPPGITNSVYSALWLLERRAHQEHLSALRGKDNQHLPSPASDSPCSVTSMNPFDVPRWICVRMCFYQFMCFSHLLCFGPSCRVACFTCSLRWDQRLEVNTPEFGPGVSAFPFSVESVLRCAADRLRPARRQQTARVVVLDLWTFPWTSQLWLFFFFFFNAVNCRSCRHMFCLYWRRWLLQGWVIRRFRPRKSKAISCAPELLIIEKGEWKVFATNWSSGKWRCGRWRRVSCVMWIPA